MPSETVVPQSEERICAEYDCENKATHRCAGCKQVWYCCTRCQKQDWTLHIFDCNPKGNIRSAHYLARACRQDLMPTDPQTLEDYGFNRACTGDDSGMLLGLYQGIFIIHRYELKPRVLDQWLKEGTLVEHIKETFEGIPPNTRGAYYPWFLKNQWILDGSPIPSDSTALAQVNRMERTLWEFLGPARKAESRGWPREKLICVAMYRFLLSEHHPGPLSPPEEYIDFGFCVARDMYIEMSIARLYVNLIPRCTFEEFFDAYTTSSLISLMEAKGVISNRNNLPRHFEHVMSSRTVRESVWRLKHYLYADGNVTLSSSISIDYGFFNCRNQADEFRALTTAYKTAFDHRDFDEMELHTHCKQGSILDYIGKFQRFSKKEKKIFARLMKNPYPLPGSDSVAPSSRQHTVIRGLLE